MKLNRKGFFEIMLALGFLTILAVVAGTMSYFTVNQAKRAVQKLDRREGFYNGEVALWHGFYRSRNALAFIPSPGSTRAVASMNNQYDSALSGFSADTYTAASYPPGTPLNVKSTMQFDSARTLLRRYSDGNLFFLESTSGPTTFCGITKFTGPQTYRTCLVTPGNPCIGIPLSGPSTGSLNSGTHGLVRPFVPSGYAVNAIASDGTGKVYVGGSFTNYTNGAVVNGIARLNSDGSLDTSFSTGTGFTYVIGTLSSPGKVLTIVPDGTGKLYVGGDFNTFNGTPAKNIARLNSNGSLDGTFVTGTGFDQAVNAIALVDVSSATTDIFVGGSFITYDGVGYGRIVRLKNTGGVSAGFSTGTGFNSEVFALLVPAAGDKVYVGGSFTSQNGTPAIKLVRLDANSGTVDGVFAVGTGFDSTVYSLAFVGGASADILVGGSFVMYQGALHFNMVRLHAADATLEPSFNPPSSLSLQAYSIVPANDGTGSIYVGGYCGCKNMAVRLKADGTVDTAFAVGLGFANAHGILGRIQSIARADSPSTDVFIGGDFSGYNGTGVNNLVRIRADGSLNQSFNTLGSGFDYPTTAVVPTPDGSGEIYVGGQFSNYQGQPAGALIRLTANGTRNSRFNLGTGFTLALNSSGTVRALALSDDGSGNLYVGGIFNNFNGVAALRITRLHCDGLKDATFNVGTGFGSDYPNVITPVGNGSGDIYVGGHFTTYNGTSANRIVRIHANGSIDTGFNTGSGFNDNVSTIVPLNDGSGKLYVGGDFTTYNGTSAKNVVRLRSDGTVDSTFNTGSGTSPGTFFAILLAPDGSGKIYIGGNFTSYNGSNTNRIARIHSDGSFDNTFTNNNGFGDVVTSLTSDGPGKIYASGFFKTFKGTPAMFVARLRPDGTLDTSFTFDSTAGFNGTSVPWIAPANDGSGKLYLGGDHATTYNNFPVDHLIRLKPDGSKD